ncbi:MAG TPA: hypothetical protein VHR47_14245 [Bacillota bacterium]|nr:hypothetical protein [Bacillota bacterium]
MKKLLLVLLMVFVVCSWNAFAADEYDRVNDALPEIKVIATLSGGDISEWSYDPATGQWGSSQPDFTRLAMVEVKYNGNEYSGLAVDCVEDVKEDKTGEAEDQDRQFSILYIFNKSSLNKAFAYNDLEKPETLLDGIKVIYVCKNTPLAIRKEIMRGHDLNSMVVINSIILKSKKVARFTMLFHRMSNYYSITGRDRFCRHECYDLTSPDTFKNHYYEVKLELFNKFFPVKEAVRVNKEETK